MSDETGAAVPDDGLRLALDHLLTLPGEAGARRLVAIAGPPGAGKSTLAAALCAALGQAGRRAAVVPMDGFHLDNRVLEARGLLARKGAAETFDAAGFCHLVARIATGGGEVVYPVFDRARDIAIAGAAVLEPEVEFVLVEGNYLLLRDAPWSGLARHWDATIRVDAPLAELEARLMARWHALPEAEARARVAGNDLPNIHDVRARSAPADLVLDAPGR